MVEVQPVGHLPEQRGGRPPGDPVDEHRARVGRRQAHHPGADGEEEHPAAREEPLAARADDEEGGERDGEAEKADRLGRHERRAPPQSTAVVPAEEHGHPGTDEQRLRAGVGAVVEAREVDPFAREVRGPPRRGERERGDDGEAPGPAAPEEHEEQRDEGRDEQVELLLHAEGPRVPQRRGVADLLEVGVLLADEAPVLHEEEAGEDVTGVAVPVRRADEQPGDHDGRARDDQRRDEPLGPPPVEAQHVDRAAPGVLGDQQPGDEVPGEGEEVVDADPATDERRDPEVVQQHEGDEEASVPVEGGEALRAGGGRQVTAGRGEPHEPARA